MLRRSINNKREKQLFIKRFYPAGTYTWTVPAGCEEVDVFLVGGGGGSGNGSGAGSGYTKTFKKDSIGVKQGNQVSVVPGQSIEIIVGKGGEGLYYGYPDTGGYSQFMNSNYRANGGNPSGNGLLNGENSTGGPYTGGNGGSGGSVDQSSDHWNEKLCTFSSSGDTLYFTIDNNTGETWASGSYGAYAVPNETGLHTAYVDVILKNIRNY